MYERRQSTLYYNADVDVRMRLNRRYRVDKVVPKGDRVDSTRLIHRLTSFTVLSALAGPQPSHWH